MLNLLCTLIIINGVGGKIQGTVKEEDTNEPIPYADVIIVDTQLGVATDEDGNFFILNVIPGRHTIEFSCVGYQTKRIENVVVEIDHTTRLNVSLKQTPIEISPITVISETPAVKKDMVSTTYIIRKEEITALPIDYTINLVLFQPAVARRDTLIHVRGGRATEVQYMIDNVSIIDPQTGDLAINLSKGVIDEIIFLPGGFDAEYGRAMSGVINMITTRPAKRLQAQAYAKTERIMPFYYDFGYENVQSSIHLPLSKTIKGFISFDIMHTDDWNPKLFVLPHKERDDYALYGKCLFAPSGKLRVSISGAKSRTQFDRYNTLWKFYLDHYRSDMRIGDLEAVHISYLPNTKSLFTINLSRLYTDKIYGVREERTYGLFDDFSFREYHTLEWPRASNRNPFGVYVRKPYAEGDFPEYEKKSSLILKANTTTNLQVHKYHEIKAGCEYSNLNLKNFHYFVSNRFDIKDEYEYYPREFSVFLQDNIDYEGLYTKIGCRYDYYAPDIDGVEPKIVVSPRIGFSFLVTEKFLFRANFGRFAQPPLYDYLYTYYNLLPLPSYLEDYIPLVGNPDLVPEKTVSYEIGLQGEIRENVSTTLNTFYKEVSDLIGTQIVPALPISYVQYFNIEHANIKGIEAILDFHNSLFIGKISYTLSWARGTSSYAEEVYYVYYYDEPDTTFTRQTQEFDLDFDQRHRVFIQGVINLPLQTNFYMFGYFGQGFPYTPPGPEGKIEERNILRLDFQRQIDCVITKSLTIGSVTLSGHFEIINLLDTRYPLGPHYPLIPYEDIRPWEFSTMSLTNKFYSPAADRNHDGLITPQEQVQAYRELSDETDDWVSVNSAPRRARIGLRANLW